MQSINVYVSSKMDANPGLMFPGGMIVDHNGIFQEKYSWEAGYGTNMLVELLGIEHGLRLSYSFQPAAISVYSPNLPIIEQLRGTTSKKAQNLVDTHSRIAELLKGSTVPVQFQWIPKDGMNTWTGYLHKKRQQRGPSCAQ